MREAILLVLIVFCASTCAHALRGRAEEMAARAERGNLSMQP